MKKINTIPFNKEILKHGFMVKLDDVVHQKICDIPKYPKNKLFNFIFSKIKPFSFKYQKTGYFYVIGLEFYRYNVIDYIKEVKSLDIYYGIKRKRFTWI